jgi:hypothetical protein
LKDIDASFSMRNYYNKNSTDFAFPQSLCFTGYVIRGKCKFWAAYFFIELALLLRASALVAFDSATRLARIAAYSFYIS